MFTSIVTRSRFLFVVVALALVAAFATPHQAHANNQTVFYHLSGHGDYMNVYAYGNGSVYFLQRGITGSITFCSDSYGPSGTPWVSYTNKTANLYISDCVIVETPDGTNPAYAVWGQQTIHVWEP